MKNFCTVLCLTVICLVLFCASSLAADFSEAYISETPVVINDQYINDPDFLPGIQWPCLVYNDIIYFPMTYTNAQLVGLDVSWDEVSGLTVSKSDLSSLGYYYRGGIISRNWSSWEEARKTIHPADFKITVNGKEINNAAEKYPLIVFMDTTYFPLTWRFAVEEFGWSYGFDAKNGLEITANSRFRGSRGLYYYKDGVKIWASTPIPSRGGPPYNNLHIEIDGVERLICDPENIEDSFSFGYDTEEPYWNCGNIFDVRDGWVYTTAAPYPAMFNGIAPQFCKVNIETGEVVML